MSMEEDSPGEVMRPSAVGTRVTYVYDGTNTPAERGSKSAVPYISYIDTCTYGEDGFFWKPRTDND